jgi:hypothetical protein
MLLLEANNGAHIIIGKQHARVARDQLCSCTRPSRVSALNQRLEETDIVSTQSLSLASTHSVEGASGVRDLSAGVNPTSEEA